MSYSIHGARLRALGTQPASSGNPAEPPTPALVLLLLGSGPHLLVERAVRDLEASEGTETDEEDGKEEESSQKAVEDACSLLGESCLEPRRETTYRA